jgi:hypothetical protein
MTRPLPAAEDIPPQNTEEAPADAHADISGPPESAGSGGGAFSPGKVFILELLCYIPVLNFFLLAIMSVARYESAARVYARGKLLASMTVLIMFLLAALTLVTLLAYDIIEPIYLGRWRV